MLQLEILENELFDDNTQEFIFIKNQTLKLEHSLISLRKWESKWHVPFLSTELNDEQVVDYIRFMTITKNVDPIVYSCLTNDDVEKVTNYINDPMTATWFAEDKNKSRNREIITSEIVYFWMTQYKIPFECEKWHLNQLLTLIRVCQIKNSPQKKMRKSEIYAQNRAINAARKKKFNTKG